MVFRSAIIAFWVLVIGLACVYLEFARIRIGHRIHENVQEIDATTERLRLLEIEYSRLVSPDTLDERAEDFLREDGLDRPGA